MADELLSMNKWNIHDQEISNYLAHYKKGNKTIYQLYIPVMMPLIPGPAKPIQILDSLNDSIYINDASCKPSIAKTIRKQNYKTVENSDNRQFTYQEYPFGAVILVEVKNYDVHNLTVSNKIDNSFGKRNECLYECRSDCPHQHEH